MDNQVKPRPNGVWCYDKNTNELIKPEDWANINVSGGVIVITEDQAFRVLPHNTIVAPWGNPDRHTTLCGNKDAVCGEELTDEIIKTYKGVEYTDDSNDAYNFIGSPAAEFCKSVGGYLPSVFELKLIAKYIKEINKCMRIMDQPTLMMGWYWSSVEEDSFCAWNVSPVNGDTIYDFKHYPAYVCAISEFQF